MYESNPKMVFNWLVSLTTSNSRLLMENSVPLLSQAMTDKINDRETFMKGIDYSYYYEQEDWQIVSIKQKNGRASLRAH